MMEPIGAPKIVKFALCNMFSACTHPYVKDKVLKSFCDPNGILRIEVTIIVFGMGLHCLNVCWIIHGFSSDIKLYLQETGRAGCDGKEAVVCQLIIPLKAGACSNAWSWWMEYCRNKECKYKFYKKTLMTTVWDGVSRLSVLQVGSVQCLWLTCNC